MNLFPIESKIVLVNFVAMLLSMLESSEGARLPTNDVETPDCNCGKNQRCMPRQWSEQLSLDSVTCVDDDMICEHLFGKYSQGRYRRAVRKSRSVRSVSFRHTTMCREMRHYKPFPSDDEPCWSHEDNQLQRQLDAMTRFDESYVYQCDVWFPQCDDDGFYAPKQILSNNDESTAWCVRPDGTPTCRKDCLIR